MADTIVSHIVPVSFPDKNYSILYFGALGDGKTFCKEAFDKAIMHCSENGGGKIIVPKGNYYMNGPLVFKSNVHIELEAGAILNFSHNENDYLPAVLVRWEGTEAYNYSPLIYAYHVKNIALTGKGTINGNGSKNFSKWKKIQNTDKETLRKMGRENLPVYRRVFGDGFKLRPSFFQPYGCTSVLLEGITIEDSPFWVIHPTFCDNVIIRGVTVNSYNTNNDGCDPESCSNVLIEGCTFSTGDDSIAIKAGRDNDAWRIGRPTENVVIRNCNFQSKINGVCIGSEMSGGVRNVFIENIKIPKSSNALYFKSNLDRGGYIKNVFVRNIQADSVRTSLIRFEPNYKGEKSSFNPTVFDNFHIENVYCTQSKEVGLYLSGIKNHPIKNINLKNITINNTPQPYVLEHAKDIFFEKVKINGKFLNQYPKPIKLIPLKTL
ncbi:glycoside hydrolase family 28 protein [Flavivirga amylovorans]|uniref:Glycoside hydrolase family 28 protein n=2 Tax=Flavivirga amylovorans TaxID=870486 RepID=A0ABT8X0Y0_9FLAO|nr:glycoside hydrolase family 28 protein [Flavivirga amylovorans]